MSIEFKKPTLLVILIASILAILFNINRDYFSLSIISLLIIFLLIKKKYSDGIICIVLLIFSFSVQLIKTPSISNETKFEVKIVSNKSTYYIGEFAKNKYLIYKNDTDFNSGSVILIEGKVTEIKNQSIPLIFNFKQFLYYQKVFYQINATEITLIKENYSQKEKIKDFLTSGIKDPSHTFIRMFLFNEKGDDVELIYSNLSTLSLLHLFTISGYHINILFSIIYLLLSKVLDKNQSQIISFLILFPYLYILGFAISALRAFLYLVLKYINKIYDLKFSTIDILAFIALGFILVNPLVIFNLSFIYSFILVFTIELSKNLIKNYSKLTKSFLISELAFFSLLPISLYNNFELNLIAPFMNLLITPIISFLYLFSFLILIIKPLDILLNFFITLFSATLNELQFFNLIIIFGKPNLYFILIYYLLFLYLLLLFQKRKFKDFKYCLYLFYLLIAYQYFKVYLTPFYSVHFIDVGQGDSTIIIDRFSQSVIMIDTGGLTTSDVATRRTVPYLKALGIKRIDYLILTHPDFDHAGAKDSLISNFYVGEIIEENNFEFFRAGSLAFQNLNPGYNYDNENDNSIVLYTNINGYNYLFTGDISQEVEEKIIIDYPDLQVDFLKIAHHGSNYSSSEDFLKAINPKYAFISCGLNNRYKHPGDRVIDDLNKLAIIYYRTDYDGLVKVEHIFGKIMIKKTI